MLRKKKFVMGGLIVFLAIAYLGYTAFTGAATWNYTVSEIMAQGNSIYGETVRVSGLVSPGSVKQEALGTLLEFTIVDMEGDASLPVIYQGVVPDTFQVGNEIVVEGHLDSSGDFQADTLMPKCPSKYLPE